MEKILALYQAPGDATSFMDHYQKVHLPLVQKLPGLLSVELTRINRTFVGQEGNFLLATMVFEDAASLKTALRSPENAAVVADAAAFAGPLITVMTGSTVTFDGNDS